MGCSCARERFAPSENIEFLAPHSQHRIHAYLMNVVLWLDMDIGHDMGKPHAYSASHQFDSRT